MILISFTPIFSSISTATFEQALPRNFLRKAVLILLSSSGNSYQTRQVRTCAPEKEVSIREEDHKATRFYSGNDRCNGRKEVE